MEEEPPSEQRLVGLVASPLLQPVDTFEQLIRQRRADEELEALERPPKFNEYRLRGQPKSLQAFTRLFKLAYGTQSNGVLIWVSDTTFLCTEEELFYHEYAGDFPEMRFKLCLSSDPCDHFTNSLSIHSLTLEGALSCLDFLVGLPDSHYLSMAITFGNNSPQQRRVACPFPKRLLENFLINTERKKVFNHMVFSREQSTILASTGVRTNIQFCGCELEGGGADFLEASTARQDEDTGPAVLSILETLLFDEGNLVLFLNQRRKLESLTLQNIWLRTGEACRAVSLADVRKLHIHGCNFADDGAALIESLMQGRGPRELFLRPPVIPSRSFQPFDSLERFLSFMNALRGNTYLERLDVSLFPFDRTGSVQQLLAHALLENQGLIHLDILCCDLDDESWSGLMGSIFGHPTLRILTFAGSNGDESETWKRTKDVAEMLLVNNHVDQINVGADTFNSAVWDAIVAPTLERNLYRKRFLSIQKIEVPSTRAAIMARALAHVESKPHLVSWLLSQNHDILFTYLESALAVDNQSSISHRKRSRSPSSDKRVGH
jgi:hypothetical protein